MKALLARDLSIILSCFHFIRSFSQKKNDYTDETILPHVGRTAIRDKHLKNDHRVMTIGCSVSELIRQ